MSLRLISSIAVRCLLSCICLAAAVAAVSAGDLPTRFFDGAAREMLAQLQGGEGWLVVSERGKVVLVPAAGAVDCVKYRVVTNYSSGKTSNDQFFLQVEYSAETPWISLEFGMPKNSCTSLAAAKKANEAVGLLDTLLPQIEAALQSEENAELRNLGQQLATGLRGQRAALVDLIQKDIQAIK